VSNICLICLAAVSSPRISIQPGERRISCF
jgi:hypothetical protein